MRINPRSIYLWLLVGVLVGALASIPLIAAFPPTDLAKEHAAATTPFARAVTSPAMDITCAVLTCILFAWLLAMAAFFLWWRGPRRAIFIEAFSVIFMMQLGFRAVHDLHKLPRGGLVEWTFFLSGMLAGTVGVVAFVAGLRAAWKGSGGAEGAQMADGKSQMANQGNAAG